LIVGRKEYVKQYRKVADVVIKELGKVHQEIQSSPDEAARLLAKETKIGEDIWKKTLSRRGYGVFPLTKEVIDAQQRIADRFYELGLIPKTIKVRDAVIAEQ
jgi:sulfonate transport system substrate-binding protein